MDDRTFIKLIENPKGIDAKALDQLVKVIEKYPYFSLAKLIYLKGLKVNGDARFSTLLSHVSTYAPSGEWLYLYLSDYELGIPTIDESHEEALEEKEHSNVDAVSSEQPEISQPNAVNSVEDASPIAIITDIEENADQEHLASAALVEESILAEEDQEGQCPVNSYIAADEELPESKIEESTEEEEPTITLDDEVPFELIDDELVSDKEDPILEILDQKLYTLDDNEKILEIQNSLIDQFLSANPRIVPKPDLPPVNEDISIKSLEDDGDLVTETLAKIYAAQGLIEKAADIYRKLCLKFPEKKAYFVAQLEKLKESK